MPNSKNQETVTKLKLDVPEGLSKEERSDVALQVADHILDNANKQKTGDGQRLARYTKDYKKKKGTSVVDLQLSHEMMDKLNQLTSKGYDKKGMITVGFRKGTKAERKAEGNILGTYGQKSPIPGKSRPFLSISDKKLNQIIKGVIESREDENSE